MDATGAKKGRTGRPGLVIANRLTTCSQGHAGSITLWGRRGWTGAPYRRQRFRCVPDDGSAPHTFSLGRCRPRDAHGAGDECLAEERRAA